MSTGAVWTCYALTRAGVELYSTTLHLPIRCYAEDDLEGARRVSRLLTFPQRVKYLRALTTMCTRPLESERGLQTYASLRASPGKEAVTVYLAPQAYSHALASVDAPPSFFDALVPPQVASGAVP